MNDKKILLHICCGPCAVYPVNVLQDKNFSFEGFFYNPNIHPKEEFLKRMENVKIFSEKTEVPVWYEQDFQQEIWENFKEKDGQRCQVCYTIRLEKTASFAKKNGFTAYTTTLLVSPYQNHELIKQLGTEFAEKYGIEFFYEDFRLGFREGQKIARDMGLYRQKYCGCIISLNN